MRNYREAEALRGLLASLPRHRRTPGPGLRADWAAWFRLQHYGDVAAVERELRELADSVGFNQVLAWLVDSSINLTWFGLPDWGFREDLRRVSFQDLQPHGLPGPGVYYHARAESELATGNRRRAEAYFDSLRVFVEGVLRDQPGAGVETRAGLHAVLGVAYAGLGRSDAGLREAQEARRLAESSPEAEEVRPFYQNLLVRTLVLSGEFERAVPVLDTLLSRPGPWSKEWLRLHPMFDPLRSDSSFLVLLERH
jgi:hypothetical protein